MPASASALAVFSSSPVEALALPLASAPTPKYTCMDALTVSVVDVWVAVSRAASTSSSLADRFTAPPASRLVPCRVVFPVEALLMLPPTLMLDTTAWLAVLVSVLVARSKLISTPTRAPASALPEALAVAFASPLAAVVPPEAVASAPALALPSTPASASAYTPMRAMFTSEVVLENWLFWAASISIVVADCVKSVAASMLVPTSLIEPVAVRDTLPEPDLMDDTRAVLAPSSCVLDLVLNCTPAPALALASALPLAPAEADALAWALAATPALPALAPAPACALA